MRNFYDPKPDDLTRLSDEVWCASYSGGKDSTSLVTWVEWPRRLDHCRESDARAIGHRGGGPGIDRPGRGHDPTAGRLRLALCDDPIGVRIEIVPHSLASKDLYGPTGLTLIPTYTAVGRKASYCSGHWKRDVIERYLRREKAVKECVQWIGYSIDELRRVPAKDHRLWCKLEFPLIDKHINRAVAIGIIQRAGLPVPRKSRCWMCPHQDEHEWQEIWESPEEWEAACQLEEEVNASDPEQTGQLYLHNSRVPLRQVDLSQGIPTPAAPCEGGHCWT